MEQQPMTWKGTTILSVRKGADVVVAGDGQVTFGNTVMKSNAKKVRRLGNGDIIAGFAGSTADAFTLFERLETKIEKYSGQLTRACVELAKDWRTDRYLRRLEAMMIVADKALSDTDMTAEEIALKSMQIAADICIYTNHNIIVEKI